MSVELQVETADGSTATIPAQRVASDLRQMGVQASLSPDGSMLEYDLDGVPMEMPVIDFVSQSIGPVIGLGFSADSTDFSTVDPELRLGIENLPNDSLRQKYLELNLESQGFENPKIIGKGSDWAMFDPASGSYKALTNRPGLDISELGQVGAIGAQALGSIIGGAAGASIGTGTAPGFGTFAGGAAGAATGGQIGRGLVDAYLAAQQPAYRELLGNLGSEEVVDIAIDRAQQAALDLAFGGAASGLPVLAPALAKGALTRAGATVSDVAQKGAYATRQALGAIQNPLGQQVGAELAFQTGPVSLGAFLAQGPAYATRKAPEALRWLGQKTGSTRLQGIAEELARPISASGIGDRIVANWQSKFGLPFSRTDKIAGPASGDVLSRAGSLAGRAIDDIRNARAIAGGGKNLPKYSAEIALKELGKATGRGFEAAASAGRGIESGIERGMGALYGAGRLATYPIDALGRAGKFTFGMAQPLEYRTYGAIGSKLAEEQY